LVKLLKKTALLVALIENPKIGDRHLFGAEFLPAKTEFGIPPSTQRNHENMPVPFLPEK
jgi:hypothetical protein